MTALSENLERLEDAITAACNAAGRARDEVELMAVSKTDTKFEFEEEVIVRRDWDMV